HLREAGPPGATSSLLEHLAGLVNLLAQGQACAEVLRRLTGKCLMSLARDEAAVHTVRAWFGRNATSSGKPSPLGRLVLQDLREQGLDLAFFYLDDGIIAGDVHAVVRALQLVQRRAPALGLRLNLSKCEVSRFQRSLDLLGAAVGDDAFVSAHTNARVDAAAPLLEALAQLEDAQ
ncbi:unnamed protein product, partial [Symbiodinium sp. KB8]